ncbi:AAA family ATPase [Allosediminivita pacifica]|uniref:Putative kinase n=1 Tax=Allosediminivita pacifica TaxID=1267769 RepID=A0A2T6AQD3_9RHOB|nr:AAA family ATPase [Allosediminivita pacifica]PTX46038.1 putative kinase [Allosediminivita pacifica]GGB18813.1 kinase [Allosediminivita pacifica]
MARLVALSGLPGVGKTTLARALARRTGAVHLRVDTVEAALAQSTLAIREAADAGYVVLAGVAKDNLLLGRDVILDTVNPVALIPEMWAGVARDTGCKLTNVEVTCSDRALHRRRVETRQSDVPGLVVPSWSQVLAREFEPWQGDRLVVDTAGRDVSDCVTRIVDTIRESP